MHRAEMQPAEQPDRHVGRNDSTKALSRKRGDNIDCAEPGGTLGTRGERDWRGHRFDSPHAGPALGDFSGDDRPDGSLPAAARSPRVAMLDHARNRFDPAHAASPDLKVRRRPKGHAKGFWRADGESAFPEEVKLGLTEQIDGN